MTKTKHFDTREHFNRFPRDQQLRNHGWRIVARPKIGEPTWINVCGIVMTESDALAFIDESSRRNREA
jgi:hypothetical protein